MIGKWEYIVIGGGVVGLATAFLLHKKKYKVLVLEKESGIAQHQSGRNSGVIHSGIYYKPGSLKSVNCIRGKKLLEDFCEERQIPYRKCGKLIVATDLEQKKKLDSLHRNAAQVGIKAIWLDSDQMYEIEPHCKGIAALHLPETGIVDYKVVCRKLKKHIEVRTHNKVIAVKDGVVTTDKDMYHCGTVINCAGLYADKIAQMCGVKTDLQIIPFRGIYYTLKESAQFLCKSLIYPVPDPQFPFLGVHFTSTIDGGVEVGPNAVLATGREAYTLWDTSIRETLEILAFRGARKLFRKHWKMGLKEMWTAFSKKKYTRELQKLVPGVRSTDLLPRPSGIRAQAVDRDGNLVDDFRIVKEQGVVHVLNAPSPAATACLAIGEHITQLC
jgi:L-2-hydroxyglutarate oxidase